MKHAAFVFLATMLAALPVSAAPGKHAARKTSKAPATPAPILSTELDGQDILFLKSAAECASLVVQLGEHGMARATMPEVRGLGEIVAQNYGQLATELGDLAASKHVVIGAGKARADATLKGLKGLKFDKALVEQLVEVQGRALEVFNKARASNDPDVRAFAEENASKVRTQYIVARRIIGESAPAATPAPSPAAAAPAAR